MSGFGKVVSSYEEAMAGSGCIRQVLTDLACLEIEDGAFILKERAPGVTVEEIASKTAGKRIIPDEVPGMTFA